ncbi:2-oxoacid:acceptor oxidoreductase family protein [Candidatus Bathyarchaeota archaeon]|nr:2-oxoacid:acceptor oxidoreductase family protein [Candidatus Bathyarchaeota archaeon]
MGSTTSLIEVIFYGRGGMGVVTAAEVLAEAVSREGKYGQAIPIFGVERRGAPVRAFGRISNEPIQIRSEIYEPDYSVVIHASVMDLMDVSKGLKKDGVVIVNSHLSPRELSSRFRKGVRVASLNATKIALEELGVAIANTAMLGAFARVSGQVGLKALTSAALMRFSGEAGQRNVNAIKRAYEEVQFE